MTATYKASASGSAATERFRFNRHRFVRLASDRGLSDTALAEKAGVSRWAVHRMRTGQQVPSFVTVAAVADVLNVSLDLLVERMKDESA